MTEKLHDEGEEVVVAVVVAELEFFEVEGEALWASGACNQATLQTVLAVGAYFGAVADGAGWLTLGSLWGVVATSYNNELTACQIP